MPKGVVKTKRDEALWKKAKAAAHKQYPNLSEEGEDFWKIVQSIYGDMKKATQFVKKPLLLKAAEIIGMYSKDKVDRDLVLETYYVLHYHLSATQREVMAKAVKKEGRAGLGLSKKKPAKKAVTAAKKK